MSCTTAYTCDICRTTINRIPVNNLPSGFGLRWSDSLRVYDPWQDCPLHICAPCFKMLGEIHDQLKKDGKLGT